MSFIKEFRDFAVKGNMVDLAVGFIVGGAFKTLVSSLVNDIAMPPIGMALGGTSFGQLYINLNNKTYENLNAAVNDGAPVIKYGSFIQNVVDFTIIAFVVFMMVKFIKKMQELRIQDEEAPETTPPEPNEEVVLLREIRDSLAKQ